MLALVGPSAGSTLSIVACNTRGSVWLRGRVAGAHSAGARRLGHTVAAAIHRWSRSSSRLPPNPTLATPDRYRLPQALAAAPPSRRSYACHTKPSGLSSSRNWPRTCIRTGGRGVHGPGRCQVIVLAVNVGRHREACYGVLDPLLMTAVGTPRRCISAALTGGGASCPGVVLVMEL